MQSGEEERTRRKSESYILGEITVDEVQGVKWSSGGQHIHCSLIYSDSKI